MNRLTINADLGKHTINRHIYGHFAEHLGRCIYDGIWVGEDSPIPNVRGIRTDIVEALRALDMPNLRWPGGCFADEYHWMDGIGPREERPATINTHWGGVTETNHFGTHEFLDLCDQLGCEPYICGNVGSGTVQEMAQWVEYLNCDAESAMTKLRAENGRGEPWGLRYWGVGNENWGCGGRMRPEYYADQYRRYSTYCKDYGIPRLRKIACGPTGADYHWTEVLMREAAQFMWGLALHYYTSVTIPGVGRASSATEFGEDEWFLYLQKALFIDELITRHSTIMDKYDPEQRVALVVDEWGSWYNTEPGTNPRFMFQQNTLRDALIAAIHLNVFNQHCDRVRMANIAQTINVLQAMVLTEGDKMILTPTYHVFEMFKVHQRATLVPLDIQCDDYAFGDGSVPGLSASASRDDDGRVHLSICNLHANDDVDVSCVLRGMAATDVTGRILTADAINAHNTFDEPEAVRPAPFDGATLDGDVLSIALPSKSVVVLEIS